MAFLAKQAFAQVHDVTSVLGYPTDCIVYMGLTLKTTQKMQLVQNIINSIIMGTPYFIWIIPPF